MSPAPRILTPWNAANFGVGFVASRLPLARALVLLAAWELARSFAAPVLGWRPTTLDHYRTDITAYVAGWLVGWQTQSR